MPHPFGSAQGRLLGGWPTLLHDLFFLSHKETWVPHPFGSAQGRLLRFLQGWAAMLLLGCSETVSPKPSTL
ncbi:hypothetical protein SBA7_960016 [Candidatus Sulfotelmatobacter sp. SbA7]|nr:hypothetical protein SBA7_960016 [Candidatus Sulfotelmatobacter sp. SbA7]